MIEKVKKIVTEEKDEIRRQYKAKVKGIFGRLSFENWKSLAKQPKMFQRRFGKNTHKCRGDRWQACGIGLSTDIMTLTILLSGKSLRN